eukprot:CAMPEP_0172522492 /NCGR_PEP_ID=MMETSP1066-20121228/293159_1 /TAXON_ID=671091 /ORGANISM="Coscinodiscus wailesii, Strain CCMP2513" /LENGTH=186 /DNA_ID=CAMNT_0013305507 /DNA_START=61 /DNA_END=622 /DNA_ORIENTATION=-
MHRVTLTLPTRQFRNTTPVLRHTTARRGIQKLVTKIILPGVTRGGVTGMRFRGTVTGEARAFPLIGKVFRFVDNAAAVLAFGEEAGVGSRAPAFATAAATATTGRKSTISGGSAAAAAAPTAAASLTAPITATAPASEAATRNSLVAVGAAAAASGGGGGRPSEDDGGRDVKDDLPVTQAVKDGMR